MAEVESSPGSARMGLLINSAASSETLKKRPLENGHADGVSLRYKRRNVVVTRDFPRDCGRFTGRVNGVSKEGDGSSKVGQEIVEPEPVEDSGVLGGSQAPEWLNGLVQAESETSKASTSETAKLLETSGQVEALQTVKAVEHETLTRISQALESETTKPLETSDQVVELKTVKAVEHETSAQKSQAMDSEAAKPLEISDQVEEIEMVKPLQHETSICMSQTLDSETVKPLVTLDHMEVPGPTQNVESVAMVLIEHSGQIESPEVSKSLDPQNTSDTGLGPPDCSVLPETLDVSKFSDQPQLSVPIVEATAISRLPVKIPQPIASVIRCFPPGCGRNATFEVPKSLEPPPGRSVLPETSDVSKVSDQQQLSVPIVEATVVSCLPVKIPQRRASVIRLFPPGCGRNANRGRLTGEHRPTEKSVKDDAGLNAEKVKNEDALSVKLKSNVAKEIEAMVWKDARDASEKITEQAPGTTCSETMDDAMQTKGEVQEGDAPSDKFKGNVAKEIGDEVRVISEEVFGKEMTEEVQVRTTSDIKLKQEDMKEISIKSPRQISLSRLDTNFQSVGDKSITEVGIPNGKLGKEVKHSKERSSKRPFRAINQSLFRFCAINQSHGTEIASLEPSDEKVIVQALMAAPYCPWRRGESAIKSIPTIGMARNKSKKHELLVQDKSASISKKKRAESGESKKNKLPPTKMGSYQGLGQLLLRDENDTEEQHEEDENVILDKKPQDFEVSFIPFGLNISRGKGDSASVTREKVRETLRVFQVIFRKFLQGEEAHSKDQGKTIRRIDLRAAAILKKANKWVNTEKILGSVPGVEVGDEFHYRVELAIVGLHGPFQSGIESIKKDGKVLATSIVASGGYPDDMDSSDVLIYSGQGGKPMGGKKQKQAEDQKLERGNLALKNSMDTGTVVRVIRGFKEMDSSDSADSKAKVTMTYTYDGLYVVEGYRTESSHYGTSIFKFKLRRIPGQPELAWKEVKKSRKSKVREGLCVVDISQGKEKMPIGAVNTIDDEKPQPFTYITKMIYPDWYNPNTPKGCDCLNRCLDPKICSCAAKNGGDIPFNYDGAIVQAKTLVYECGPSCRCPPSCYNRVSQHGIKFQLEIFKTESRGWGVRSLTSIPSGSFVCEYTGELLQDKEAEQRTGNDEYLFDIGHNYNDHTLWEGLPNVIPNLQPRSPCEIIEDAGYTIDAAQYGSVGRFINHSCSPNLYAQNVLYDHDDKRMPHIMLFAAENIPPLQELTYHYNYKVGQVHDAEGNVKEKRCYCGSAACSGRLY